MKRENVRKSKACLKTLGKNGFRSPYQLLSDNSFIKAVNKSRITPFAFTDLFKNEPKFFMTKCTYEIHKPNLKFSNDRTNETENPTDQQKTKT